MTAADQSPAHDRASRFHLQFGWWSLLVFLCLGVTLETLTFFQLPWYSDAAHEVRRLMWRLANAHGTLLSIVHIALGITLGQSEIRRQPRWASRGLTGASFLLPGGFFLGGVYHFEGDPGPGIFLVPVGALLLLLSVFAIARRE